jgi:ribosomal protein S17E
LSEESQNSKKTIKHLRRGLSIYKTGRSPFWHARIYDAAKQKYVVRATKETNRIEAAEVAEEIVEAYKKKQNAAHAVTMDRSFDHYAKLLNSMTKQKSKSTRNKYAFNDQAKILFREKDGLATYFGQNGADK